MILYNAKFISRSRSDRAFEISIRHFNFREHSAIYRDIGKAASLALCRFTEILSIYEKYVIYDEFNKCTLLHEQYMPDEKKKIEVNDVFLQRAVRLIAILNVADRGIAIQIMAYRLNSM